MEKLVGKLLVATGLLISGSVACLPLASHATTNVGNIFDCGGAASNAAGAAKPNDCATATYNNLDADGAVDPTKSTDGTTQINVTVKDVLAFDLEDAAGFNDRYNNDKITLYPDIIGYGRIYANVRSAKPYTISLSAATDAEGNPGETSLANADDSAFIPARNNPAQGSNGWGIATGQQAIPTEDEYKAATYKALSQIPTTFYDSAVANDDFTKTYFPVAVSITDKIPQDTYTADVTITAAVKP